MTKRQFQAAEYAAERQATEPANRTLEQVEREYIERVLAAKQGNRTHAAQVLDISVRTLQRKLARWEQEQNESR